MSYARTAVTRMTLDMSRLDLQRSETVTLGDTNRRWEVTLINGGAPFRLPPNWTAALTGIKPDGTGLLNGCSVVDGKIVYDFAAGKEIATCVGYYPVQFDIWDEVGELVASPKLYVNVLDDVRPHEELKSEGQYTLIGDLIDRVGAAEEDINSNEELGKNNTKKIEAAEKNISDNKDSIDLLATFVPNAERIILPKAAWTGDGKTPYKATLLTAREGCYVTIWASNADSYEWLNINRPTVSTEDGEVVISAAEKPKIDLEFIVMDEPYSTRESDEGTYSAYAVLVGLQDEADRLSLGKRMSAAEEKIKSAELIGGTVSIGAADWDKDKTTITLPLEPDTLTIMWPSDEVSAALIETNGLHINQSFVDVEKDTVLLLRGRAEDYNGKLTLKYVRVPYVTDKKDRPSVQVIGARFAAAGEGGNGGTIVSGAVPCKKITIAADGWSETKNMGLTTWITGGIQLEDIQKSNLIRLLAANEETATDWSAGQVGAEITYNEEKKIYSLRVGIIGSKPSTDWQILLETLLVEDSEDEEEGPYINVVPPASDAVNKIAEHNYDEMSHPGLREQTEKNTANLTRLAERVIDKTVSDLVNYYTKSQTLTKDEINALVSTIPKFKIEVVSALPTSNISDTTVYLVKSGDDDTNLYTEYIRAGGKWEKLGTQTVDLTGYATEAWVNDILAAYVKTVDMEAYVTDLLKGYITKEDADKTYLTHTTGDQRYAKPSDIPTVPQTLPNPYALSLLGKTYNGASAVSLTVEEIIGAIKTASGGVVAWIGADNNIYLSGNLSAGNYKAYYETDGEYIEIGELTVGEEEKDYTVTFVADGATVAEIGYNIGDTIEEPAVPAKDGYTGVWETYDLSNGGNITVNAVYTKIEVDPAEPTNFFKSTPVVTDKVYGADDVILAGGRVNDSGEYRSDGGKDCLLTNYIPVKAGDEIEMTNLSFLATLNSAMYKSDSDKTMIGGFKPDNTGYVNDVTASGTVQRFKIAHADAGYVRICGTPDSGILKNSTAGLKVHERYDLTQVIVNVKRGGEYL